MLSTRLNKAQRVAANAYGVTRVDKLARRKGLLMKLDFSMVVGRRSIGFGVSRANDLVFPKGYGVESSHFILHFDASTAQLLLTDTSNAGTWIEADGLQERHQLLSRATRVVSQDLIISVGDERRFQFHLSVTMLRRRQSVFCRMFQAYLRTLDATPRIPDHSSNERALDVLGERDVGAVSRRHSVCCHLCRARRSREGGGA